MGKGRRPIPTTLKILAGNPGRRPLNEDEPELDPGDAEIPIELQGEHNEIAAAEWVRAVDLLISANIYTDLDRTALLAYCLNYQRWRQAEAKMQAEGLFVMTDTGYVMASPEIRASESAFAILKSMMLEFGMTPASRTKLKITDPNKNKDPLDEFAGRAKQRNS
ncbi:MAG: phage terminase small subunit P27 family [Betaproteobacteria bacterium]